MATYAIQVPRVIGITHQELKEIAKEILREEIRTHSPHAIETPTFAPGCVESYTACRSVAEALELYLRAHGRKARVSDAISALETGGYPKMGHNPLQQVMITLGRNKERFWRDGDMIGIEERVGSSSDRTRRSRVRSAECRPGIVQSANSQVESGE